MELLGSVFQSFESSIKSVKTLIKNSNKIFKNYENNIFAKNSKSEILIILFKEIKIQDNFGLADQFYEIHILSNYLMIVLISIHILAVIVHKIFFNDNLLKRML